MKKLHKRDLLFAVFLLIFFGAILFLHLNNVYFKDGASAIYRAKLEAIKDQRLSFDDSKKKVLFVGNSKILAGIKPTMLDSLFGNKTSSLNLALGGKSASDGIQMLTTLDLDYDVLVIQDNFPIKKTDKPSTQNFLKFNNYFKDLYYFFGRAASTGHSFGDWYQKTKDKCDDMVDQKGYYYIASQALYPNHELPDTFTHSLDEPNNRYEFIQNDFIADDSFIEYVRNKKIKVYVIPNYFRKGQYLPSKQKRLSDEQRTKFKSVGIEYLDATPYILYPRKNFSDHTHLNLRGADIYTREMHTVLKEYID